MPKGELPRGVSAVIEVTGDRTFRVEVPRALAADHIRCRTRAADDQNNRISFQVSSQPGLIDDDHLDEDEYSLDDDEFLFTTQTWSEGDFRRVFSSAYTSADEQRLYIDEDQNGMTIDNPQFKYEFSEDFRVLRLSVGALLIDEMSYDFSEVTMNALVRCQ